jgi:hypothetical protein
LAIKKLREPKIIPILEGDTKTQHNDGKNIQSSAINIEIWRKKIEINVYVS